MTQDKFNEIDLQKAKPDIYYLADTFYGVINKIDFIKTHNKKKNVEWSDDAVVFNYVVYYNHFFHDASDRKIRSEMIWDKQNNHLFRTLNEAKDFLIYRNEMLSKKEIENLNNKLKNKRQKLEEKLSKCVEDKLRYL